MQVLHPLRPEFLIINFTTLFQPPAFPKETPESIKKYIEKTYLEPRLDPDEFSPERAGKQWEFDWFEKAEVPLEPSLPRSVMIPTWELPFRRLNNGSKQGKWEPNSKEVRGAYLNNKYFPCK